MQIERRRVKPRVYIERVDFFNPTSDEIEFEMPQGGPNDPIEVIFVEPGEVYRGVTNYTKFYMRQGLKLGTPENPKEFKDPSPLIDPRVTRTQAARKSNSKKRAEDLVKQVEEDAAAAREGNEIKTVRTGKGKQGRQK